MRPLALDLACSIQLERPALPQPIFTIRSKSGSFDLPHGYDERGAKHVDSRLVCDIFGG